MTDMTLNEFLVARDSAFEEVLHAEPGEERLKVFAKYEHARSRSSPLGLMVMIARNIASLETTWTTTARPST